ncbi:MAG: hypothetical protein HY077_17170 [Elusimicrobia bacterium]|nr:hypothetical protein [Elusimicrobiota bacterium]
MRSWILIACLLLPSLARAGPDDIEQVCRDRYENGTPKEILAACGTCLETDVKRASCRWALERLKDRPSWPSKKRKRAATEEALRASQQHYLSGVIYFQKGDYEKARDEWKLSKQIDPGNDDARAGLERIDKLYGPAKKK